MITDQKRVTSQITGSKKQSEERAALFAVRVHLPCYVMWLTALITIVRLLMTQGGTSNPHLIVSRRISSEIEPVGGNGVLVPLQSNAGHVGDM